MSISVKRLIALYESQNGIAPKDEGRLSKSKVRRSLSMSSLDALAEASKTQEVYQEKETEERKRSSTVVDPAPVEKKPSLQRKRSITTITMSPRIARLFGNRRIRRKKKTPDSPVYQPPSSPSNPRRKRKTLKDFINEYDRSIDSQKKLQKCMKELCESGDEGITYMFANSCSRQRRDAWRNLLTTRRELHTGLTQWDKDYEKKCNTQNELITDLKEKITEFITKMELLLQIIEGDDVKLIGYKKKDLIKHVRRFFESVNAPGLKKQLATLNLDLHTDEKAVIRIFEELGRYFPAVEELAKHSPSPSVKIKKGKNCNGDTSSLLQAISKEWDQYRDLFESLSSASKEVVESRQSHKLPSLPEEKVAEHFSDLAACFTERLCREKREYLNKQVEEFVNKLTEFMTKMETLFNALKEQDVVLVENDKQLEKNAFLVYLEEFLSSFNAEILKKYLSALEINFKSNNNKVVSEIFLEVQKYFEAVGELAKGYAAHFGLKHVSVYRNKKPHRVNIVDRFKKRRECDAKDLLNCISSELSSCFTLTNSMNILSNEILKLSPSEDRKLFSHFSEVIAILNKHQRAIDRLTVLKI